MKDKGTYVRQFSKQDITLWLDKLAVERSRLRQDLNIPTQNFI